MRVGVVGVKLQAGVCQPSFGGCKSSIVIDYHHEMSTRRLLEGHYHAPRGQLHLYWAFTRKDETSFAYV